MIRSSRVRDFHGGHALAVQVQGDEDVTQPVEVGRREELGGEVDGDLLPAGLSGADAEDGILRVF